MLQESGLIQGQLGLWNRCCRWWKWKERKERQRRRGRNNLDCLCPLPLQLSVLPYCLMPSIIQLRVERGKVAFRSAPAMQGRTRQRQGRGIREKYNYLQCFPICKTRIVITISKVYCWDSFKTMCWALKRFMLLKVVTIIARKNPAIPELSVLPFGYLIALGMLPICDQQQDSSLGINHFEP